MTDSDVFQLSQPVALSDPLTEVLRSGARALLAQAVAAEVAGFLEGHADKLTDHGRQRLVRHGQLPQIFGEHADTRSENRLGSECWAMPSLAR